MSFIGFLKTRNPFASAVPPPKPADDDLMQWSSDLSVGNGLIDGEHKAIVEMLNRLYACWKGGDHRYAAAAFEQLGRLLSVHFANEENILTANHCPGLAAHMGEHRRMIAELAGMEDRLHRHQLTEGDLARFLRHVVMDHVLVMDMDHAAYMRH